MLRRHFAALGLVLTISPLIAFAQNIPTAPVAPVQTAPGKPPVVASPGNDKAAAAKSAAKPAAKKAAGKAKAKKARTGKAGAKADGASGAPKN